jgi:hypothetical protein
MQVSGRFVDNQNGKVKMKGIMVRNTETNEKVTFRMKYHSGNYEHCEQRLMNKVY